jgi:DNA-binding CsgD family transcriptional regulator
MRALLQIEADLTDQTLDGFIEYIRTHYGLAHITYLCPSFRGRSMTDPFTTVTYSDAWTEHYKTRGYAAIDPVVNIGARSLLPIDWALLPKQNKKVQRMFDEAKEASIGQQGLTIPVRGPINGLWALFSVTSNESEASWSARRYQLQRDIVLLAHYVHQHAYGLHAKDVAVDLNAITKREIEALELSADGMPVADIAISMRISAETVKTHLDSARYKLQAINRVHAVTKAIRAGLIH